MSDLQIGTVRQFQAGMPFYKMVSAFTTAAAGVGAVMLIKHEIFAPDDSVALPLLHKPGARLSIGFREVARTSRRSTSLTIHEVMIQLVSMLLNVTYESVRRKNDRSPPFEFFRHLRNAASHENRFFFKGSEPVNPAHWRTLRIDETLKGEKNPLFGQPCIGTFAGSGDVLELLWDVQKLI